MDHRSKIQMQTVEFLEKKWEEILNDLVFDNEFFNTSIVLSMKEKKRDKLN